MGLKQTLYKKYSIYKDKRELNAISKITCDTSNLRRRGDLSLDNIFDSAEINSLWTGSKKDIDVFKIPDGSGGVNPGDRRALYYLISSIKPASVLEVGTHIGASTLHISMALYDCQIKNGKNATLTTVDIVDVNSPEKKPWLKFGTEFSPIEMINRFNYGSFVNFVTDTSVNFSSKCKQKFDFIFLDGSHAASVVYQEVPMALKLLNPNGIILLHDYFPMMKPLWSDGSLIPGPCQAIERFLKEGNDITVLPLGKLPWATKLGSNVTSLALLLRK